ncbi:lysosomal acid glucosylceramidase-like isoform X2 [Rhineura floridana]|uniref:lysosomal acid glucosylceramidase-like isoform X2 n=1 Tax=Rhineura floridana TaxID=261503 RepID=UPI002AC86205|nr:lysosomal acid glucosylceramidase-like isoform X2 [Rhineura floridana]
MRITDTGLCLLFLLLWMAADATARRPCIPKFVGPDAMVCVCNATYCDTLDPLVLPPKGSFLKYVSSKVGQRLERSEGKFWPNRRSSDAAAMNIMQLSPAAQDQLLRAYFSEEGIEYNLLRWPIACSDFSTHPYTYDDDCLYDYQLKCFSLAQEDLKLRIPLLHRITALSKRPLSLIASPWTAPAWLRTNNDVIGKAKLKGEAGDRYHKTWALYFIRFLDEYARHNITFWAITAQNEPVFSVCISQENFPTTRFSPEEQRDFIIKDLGPALAASSHKNVRLITLDDLRINLPNWAKVVIGNSTAAQYVAGIGIHWYLDSVVPSGPTLEATHFLYPNFFIIYTESCNGFRSWEPKVDLGSWERGVRYSRNIVTNLNSYVTGWIDWNLALDMNGGPNWVENFVDSPIIVNPLKDEFYKQPMFYHLAHFSKFVPEGSIRVDLTCNSLLGQCQLSIVGFLRPDGVAVVVAHNEHSWDVPFSISDDQIGCIEAVARAESIQTFLWKRFCA